MQDAPSGVRTLWRRSALKARNVVGGFFGSLGSFTTLAFALRAPLRLIGGESSPELSSESERTRRFGCVCMRACACAGVRASRRGYQRCRMSSTTSGARVHVHTARVLFCARVYAAGVCGLFCEYRSAFVRYHVRAAALSMAETADTVGQRAYVRACMRWKLSRPLHSPWPPCFCI
jgi:hypothetical protein